MSHVITTIYILFKSLIPSLKPAAAGYLVNYKNLIMKNTKDSRHHDGSILLEKFILFKKPAAAGTVNLKSIIMKNTQFLKMDPP